jgi:hypothetical protein
MTDYKIKSKSAFHHVHTCHAHRLVESALHFSTGLVTTSMNNASV